MSDRICPECEAETRQENCPRCGTRTLFDTSKEMVVDPLIGKLLDGRYRIEALLGQGGMGAVYKGTQVAMNQTVAIKVIRPDRLTDVEAAKRFHREAKAASMLSHPHSIRVFDFGQTGDHHLYMVMEYLKGCSLRGLLDTHGALDSGRVIKIASEVAQALVEAHESGLIHRDLKPDNVMVLDVPGDDSFVKVLDFGIAKLLVGSSGESSVTAAGAVIGTPQYMAPEQAVGNRQLTPALDVYALGIVLYEMLSGSAPYKGDTPVKLLMAHLHEPTPELHEDLPVPVELRELMAQMLEKVPEGRPPIQEVLARLEQLRREEMVQAAMAESAASGAAGPDTDPTTQVAPAKTRPARRPVHPDDMTRARSEGDERAPRPVWRAPMIVVGAILISLVVLIFAPGFLGDGEDPSQERASAPAHEGVDARVAGEAAPETVAPGTVVVHFDSKPPGASVFDDEASLGTTPFTHEFPADVEAKTFRFELKGYAGTRVSAEIQEGARVTAALTRSPPPRVSAPRVSLEPATSAPDAPDPKAKLKLKPKPKPEPKPKPIPKPKPKPKPKTERSSDEEDDYDRLDLF
jgi:eukaryotic-like serine/threonine-protein kinase